MTAHAAAAAKSAPSSPPRWRTRVAPRQPADGPPTVTRVPIGV